MDEMIEIWDWNEEKPTGLSVERKKAHREKIPHEGVHLWIYRKINESAELILQKRSMIKDLYPGVYDITVGGHVPFDYNDDKIAKEAYEELGIKVKQDELIDLGYFKYEEDIPEINLFHREFQRIYLLNDDRDLDSYKFIDDEVDAVAAFSYPEFKKYFNNNDYSMKCEVFDKSGITIQQIYKKELHPLFFKGPMRTYMDNLFKRIDFEIKKAV